MSEKLKRKPLLEPVLKALEDLDAYENAGKFSEEEKLFLRKHGETTIKELIKDFGEGTVFQEVIEKLMEEKKENENM